MGKMSVREAMSRCNLYFGRVGKKVPVESISDEVLTDISESIEVEEGILGAAYDYLMDEDMGGEISFNRFELSLTESAVRITGWDTENEYAVTKVISRNKYGLKKPCEKLEAALEKAGANVVFSKGEFFEPVAAFGKERDTRLKFELAYVA